MQIVPKFPKMREGKSLLSESTCGTQQTFPKLLRPHDDGASSRSPRRHVEQASDRQFPFASATFMSSGCRSPKLLVLCLIHAIDLCAIQR